MKKSIKTGIYALAGMGMLGMVACQEFDDSKLWDAISKLENRVGSIESQLSSMNGDIRAMQSLVEALKGQISISSVTDNGDSYTIKFSDGSTITIRNGHDGVDGMNGIDGKDAPVVTIEEYEGAFYWVMIVDGNREWIRDAEGNMIPVVNGVTPLLKVDASGYWMVSYDGGITYEYILDEYGNQIRAEGRDGADGMNGANGDSFFQSVTISEDGTTLIVVLLDGTVLNIPLAQSDLGDPDDNPIAEDFFTVENSEYHSGEMPEGDAELDPEDVNYNSSVLAGGLNFISISSDVEYEKFFIGVEGQEGYYSYTPEETAMTRVGIFNYMIPLIMSTNLNNDFMLWISAQELSGLVTAKIPISINFVNSESGDLNINLTFENEKDIDLHLYMPDGEHIYFGNRGGERWVNDSIYVSYGLDHDSNAGCNIDALNNENIYIPAELIQNGHYIVQVDLWSNCDPTIPTAWSIITRYKDQTIPVTYGSNPAHGEYEEYASSGDHTVAMEFDIMDGVMSNLAPATRKLYTAYPLSPIAEIKLDEMRK